MAYKDDKMMPSMERSFAAADKFDPLLVSLHDYARNYGNEKNKESFGKLVHAVLAMLDANLKESQKILAADVLITLIRQAEQDLRKDLAHRLAVRNDLPDSLLHYLAYGQIDIAEPVLKHSPLLCETDLIYIIQSKTVDHWHAIAQRPYISEKITNALVSKHDVPTHKHLLNNETIKLGIPSLQDMATDVRTSKEFAEEFVTYKHLPQDVAVSIYWHVSHALRTHITREFKVKGHDLDKALEDCVQDFSDTTYGLETFEPTNLMREVAAKYKEQGKILDDTLVNTLRRRQGRFFLALFAARVGVRTKVIHEMMKQKGGQGLAVCSRATGVSKESFVSIFLLSRAITCSRETVNAEELKMAMRYYDGITHKMAKDILTGSIAQ